MSAGQWFWIIYVISCIFGGWFGYSYGGRTFGASIVVMILVGLLGWGVFGPPLR